jgi:hypothetical protein
LTNSSGFDRCVTRQQHSAFYGPRTTKGECVGLAYIHARVCKIRFLPQRESREQRGAFLGPLAERQVHLAIVPGANISITLCALVNYISLAKYSPLSCSAIMTPAPLSLARPAIKFSPCAHFCGPFFVSSASAQYFTLHKYTRERESI